MPPPTFLAVDLGAGSGRTIAGVLGEGRLTLRELTRFPNEMIPRKGSLHWDVHALFSGMKKGLAACAAGPEGRPESLAVNTWGVDFALLDERGALVELPHTYRDPRTQGAMEAFFERLPRERVYELTGIQFMPFNTLFQLFAMTREAAAAEKLAAARDLLFMPDLFNYFFTGLKGAEFTYATTSQLFNPKKRAWEPALFEAAGVPLSLMQEVGEPGRVLGPLKKSVAAECGTGLIPVIAAASHDTASAVAAVPAEGENWAYISSGTWSIMGIETKEPIIDEKSLDLNFTNEGGLGRTFRFLKNITGLWLLERCRKDWAAGKAAGKAADYGALLAQAEEAEPFKSLVDPDDPSFMNPPDMPAAIARFCTDTGQPAPDGPGAFIRCILESLAFKYRLTLDQLRLVSPRPVERIHVVGGGVKNRLLSRFTADATGLPVVAGPVEATAAGNVMVQALAMGRVASRGEVRDVIRRSFEPVLYEPRRKEEWEDSLERFRGVAARAAAGGS